MEMYKTPRLYATSSKGDLKTWEGEAYLGNNGAVMSFTFGLEAGKKQTQRKVITKGKNIGRSNETTPFEQAKKEIISKMNKKIDSGYTSDKTNVSTPILPMLAHPFNKRKHNIKYPAYAQPKIDGVRMIAHYDGKVTTFSRKGKPFTKMPHIEKELEFYFKRLKLQSKNIYIDGELYSDTLKFEELAGAVRRSDNEMNTLFKIKYHIFDAFDLDNCESPFEERMKYIYEYFSNTDFVGNGSKWSNKTLYNGLNFIEPVRTFLIQSEQDFRDFNSSYCIPNGYEGAMIRNADGIYKLGHRSADLQKLKEFQDAEYKIIGFKEGTGTEKGCVIWECSTDKSLTFSVRPRGSKAERQGYFQNGIKHIGSMLTVRFQELTNDGIPRFPVGISIRDYE